MPKTCKECKNNVAYSELFSVSTNIIRCLRCDVMACPKCHENDKYPRNCHYLCDECEDTVRCQMGVDSIETIHLMKRAGEEKQRKEPILKKPGYMEDKDLEDKEEEKDKEDEEEDLEDVETFASRSAATQGKSPPKQMGSSKVPIKDIPVIPKVRNIPELPKVTPVCSHYM